MTELAVSRDIHAVDMMAVVHIEGEFAQHGMCAMLRKLDMHAVHPLTCPAELVEVLEPAAGAIVILEWDGSDCAAMSTLSLECRRQNASVIFFLRSGDEDMLDRAIRVPADGYLLEHCLTMNELKVAVSRVSAGNVHLPAAAVGGLLERIRVEESEPRAFYGRLTPREEQVLELLVDGFSNKQIARMLRISQHGVKRLVSNVLSKLCCSNRTSAVSLALREGLVQRRDNHETQIDGNGGVSVRAELA